MSLRSSVPRSRRSALVGGAVVVAIAASAIWFTLDRRDSSTIELVAPRARLIVETARTAEDRARGLSNRDSLTHDGLLLVWDTPGGHPIWMAHMRFALDIAWLDTSGRVLALLVDVPPCNRQPCQLFDPPGTDHSVAVLEINAGSAAHYGITPGSRISASDGEFFTR